MRSKELICFKIGKTEEKRQLNDGRKWEERDGEGEINGKGGWGGVKGGGK